MNSDPFSEASRPYSNTWLSSADAAVDPVGHASAVVLMRILVLVLLVLLVLMVALFLFFLLLLTRRRHPVLLM